jgi:hypothetical protein
MVNLELQWVVDEMSQDLLSQNKSHLLVHLVPRGVAALMDDVSLESLRDAIRVRQSQDHISVGRIELIEGVLKPDCTLNVYLEVDLFSTTKLHIVSRFNSRCFKLARLLNLIVPG